MKKIILIGFAVIFAAFSLLSCASGEQNTTNSVIDVSKNSLPGEANKTTNSALNSNMTNANSMTNTAGNQPASAKDSFWISAAQGGLAEVELGKLASTKAQNPEVKNFAQRMVTDHTKANDELKALAGEKNVTLPTDLNPAHKQVMNQLQNLSGADFDREYVNAMVRDHEMTVQMFEKQSEDNSDPDAKAFAKKQLPTLRMHLETIKNIQTKMK